MRIFKDYSEASPKGGEGAQVDHSATNLITTGSHATYRSGCRRGGGVQSDPSATSLVTPRTHMIYRNQPDHAQESCDLLLELPKRGGGLQPDPSATSLITRESHMTHCPGCRIEGGQGGSARLSPFSIITKLNVKNLPTNNVL